MIVGWTYGEEAEIDQLSNRLVSTPGSAESLMSLRSSTARESPIFSSLSRVWIQLMKLE